MYERHEGERYCEGFAKYYIGLTPLRSKSEKLWKRQGETKSKLNDDLFEVEEATNKVYGQQPLERTALTVRRPYFLEYLRT